MTGRSRTALAACVFFAFTAPLGIAAHLISELAGLGWHDDADVAFSARHGYLAAIAVASLVGLFLALRNVPRRERRTRIADLVKSLPFEGRGAGFTVVSFVAQFAFFAVTQLGEGCPLCGGDIVVGVFAAAVAALIGAFAVSLGKTRILAFAIALMALFVANVRRRTVFRRRPAPPLRARRLDSPHALFVPLPSSAGAAAALTA